MSPLTILLDAILLPALAAALALLLLRGRFAPLAGALAVAAPLLVGASRAGLAVLPPKEALGWLGWCALASGLAGGWILRSQTGWRRWLALFGLCAALTWRALSVAITNHGGLVVALPWLAPAALLGAATLGLGARPGPRGLWIQCAGAWVSAILLGATGSVKLGLLGVSLGSGLLAAGLLGRRAPPAWTASAAPAALGALGLLLLLGVRLSATPLWLGVAGLVGVSLTLRAASRSGRSHAPGPPPA